MCIVRLYLGWQLLPWSSLPSFLIYFSPDEADNNKVHFICQSVRRCGVDLFWMPLIKSTIFGGALWVTLVLMEITPHDPCEVPAYLHRRLKKNRITWNTSGAYEQWLYTRHNTSFYNMKMNRLEIMYRHLN